MKYMHYFYLQAYRLTYILAYSTSYSPEPIRRQNTNHDFYGNAGDHFGFMSSILPPHFMVN